MVKELLRCRAMESLCRQCAALYSEENWKWLAEAEMWNHRAFEHPVINSEESNAATSRRPLFARPQDCLGASSDLRRTALLSGADMSKVVDQTNG